MQGKLMALQLFGVMFITLFGLFLLKGNDPGAGFVGSLLAALGLTFLTLLYVNLKKAPR
ncbi:MAG TPA: hypothetical protein VFR08_01350 [Candidatus Angelobacter sp.]|nr:hypothetical protein [Candidatus Angelobacter sp.]